MDLQIYVPYFNMVVKTGVPHDWLFPQLPAVVHHGGVSTTAAVLRLGIPSVTVPFKA
ncbi:MAG: hypothetical protein V7L13_16935 [Nostoc sp.]|uniref:hypothetical protein n=1 Tax=Nostoc sp. TaxID=1180 RepID=UPI002FF7CA35